MADQINGQPEVDLYEISEEEFLQQMAKAQADAAQAQPTADDQPAAPAAQPRDEHGRFVSQQPQQADEPVDDPQEVDEIVYRQVIDLGDGSGVQVFEGATPEELIEKLAKAQENATRKIRELTAQKNTPQQQPVQQPQTTEEEDWLLSQELMSSPTKAFPKLFEKMTGKKISEFTTTIEQAAEINKAKREHDAGLAFVKSHPEFVMTEANANKIDRYLQTYRLEGTVENIEKAYNDLSQSGLLQTQASTTNTSNTDTPNQDPTRQRIAAPAGTKVTVIRKKAASGLSSKQTPPPPGPVSTDDLYNMPYDEFLKLGGMDKSGNW